jgi:hypothetical protein
MEKIHVAIILGLVGLVASFSIFGVVSFSQAQLREGQEEQEEAPQREVTDIVVLLCSSLAADGTADSSIIVAASSSSEEAPEIANGDGCAQAISDLRGEGFLIRHVVPAGEASGGLYYTLDRSRLI